jgi:hypothetical protein
MERIVAVSTAPHRFLESSDLTPGQMTYRLRSLRPHRMIERIPKCHRYRLTDFGLRTAWVFAPTYARILRPGLGRILPEVSVSTGPLRRCFDQLWGCPPG